MTLSSEEYRAAKGALLHRNFLPLALVAAPALAFFAALAGQQAGAPEPWWLPFGSIAIGFSWLAFWIVWSMRAGSHARRGALRVDRHGIFLDEALAVASEDIRSAEVVRAGWDKSFVLLRLRSKLLTRMLAVPDLAAGHAVVAALGRDAGHARTSYVLPWRAFRNGVLVTFYMYAWLVSPLAIVLGLLASHGARRGEATPTGLAVMLSVFALAAASYWALWARSRLHVTFGTDGISLRQWGRERWLRWSDVRGIEPLPSSARTASEGFYLVLGDGSRVRFETGRERMRSGIYEGDVVADRFREAMAAAASKDAPTSAPLLPAGVGRDPRSWIEDLRRAGAGASAGFRVAPVDPDELWKMLEDPKGSPVDRAAAATALAASRDAPTRLRLRAAAAATASPKLRVAIEAAADDDEAELAEALEALERSAR